MKRILTMLLALAMMFTLFACGSKKPAEVPTEATTETTEVPAPTPTEALDTEATEATSEATEVPTVATTTKATTVLTTKATKATNAPSTKATVGPTTKETVAPTTKATATPTTKPAATESKNIESATIDPNFKAAMDSYEKFFDEYVDIVKKYAENPANLSILSEYTTYMRQYADMLTKLNAWEQKDLDTAEAAYLIEVQGRISKKLLSIANLLTQEPTTAETVPAAEDTTTANKNQEAIAEAIALADYFFPTDRHFVKYKLQADGLYPFSESEAEYAIQNANIDWKKHALQAAKDSMEFIIDTDISQYDIRETVKTCGGADCGCTGFTEEEIQYAVDNFGINWKQRVIEDMKAYGYKDYSMVITAYDFMEHLTDLGYDDATIEYAMNNTSGYYRGEAVESEQERVKLLLSYGYTREAIIYWYQGVMDYSDAITLVDSCL